MAALAGAAALGAAIVGGCSIVIPLAPFASDDDDVTGSIARTSDMLGAALTLEDSRRARSALALAMEPAASGPIGWSNAESRHHGSFTPDGPPRVLNGVTCRTFVADIAVDDGDFALRGVACRRKPTEWDIREVAKLKP